MRCNAECNQVKSGDCVKRSVHTDHSPGEIETVLFVSEDVAASQRQAVGVAALLCSNVIYKRHPHMDAHLQSSPAELNSSSDGTNMLTAAVRLIMFRV